MDEYINFGAAIGKDLLNAYKEGYAQGKADAVKHGRWIHTDRAAKWFDKDECSECRYHDYARIDLSNFNYCPNCGAKMDLEVWENYNTYSEV